MEDHRGGTGDGSCFDDETLARLAAGGKLVDAGSNVERHLAHCRECRALIAATVRSETAISSLGAKATLPAAAHLFRVCILPIEKPPK